MSPVPICTNSSGAIILLLSRRTHNGGQNLNTGISGFLIYETGINTGIQKTSIFLNKF
jgi:hypothetical protein